MQKTRVSLLLGFIFIVGGCIQTQPVAINEAADDQPVDVNTNLSDRPSQPSYCTSSPTESEIGSLVYPIAPEYSHLPFLGQLFTAADCGEIRLGSIWGVENMMYTPGVSLHLRAAPSRPLYKLLTSLGFSCSSGATPQNCINWRSKKTMPVNDLLQFKSYAGEIAADDCIICG